MKKVIILAIFLSMLFFYGCSALFPIFGNNPKDKGICPVNYEQTINNYLEKTLFDPHSIQDLSISKPIAASCAIFPDGYRSINSCGRFHGWLISATFNAKNQFGGYTGLKTMYYWFNGEEIVYIADNPNFCPLICSYHRELCSKQNQ